MILAILSLEDTLRTYHLPEVVATSKAHEETPIAYSEIDRKDIYRFYTHEDAPNILFLVPNIYVHSDAGNPLNYNYIRMRGFAQKYVSVLINDIPTNDVESHEVFWIDYPDILSSVSYIQVQRGVGMVPYGYSSIAGTINLVGFPFEDKPFTRIFAGYGSYRTYRTALQFNSGNVDGWNFYARLSKLKTDGYREKSWSDTWSYYLALRKQTQTYRTTVVLHGGEEYTHLAYEGIDTLTLKTNRRYNPLQYDGETDFFFRPHYELHHEVFLSSNSYLKLTAYGIIGRGRFRQFKQGETWKEYFKEYWNDTLGDTEFNLVRERWVDERDFGISPKFVHIKRRMTITAGLDARYHTGRHWGMVVWADNLPEGIQPDRKYYFYDLDKYIASPYVHVEYKPVRRLNILFALQFQYIAYRFYNDSIRNLRWNVDYYFISPRIGLNYNLTDALSVFTAFAMNSREPGTRDIYDAQYPYWNDPIYDFEVCQNNVCTKPRKKPENVSDLEVGFRFRGERLSLELNAYYMLFRDALVYGGQVVDGVPILTNAGRTEHKGIELSTSVRIFPYLTFIVSGAYSDNRYVDFKGEDWYGRFDYSGNKVSHFPEYIVNAILQFETEDLFSAVILRSVGKQYIDPQNRYTISPYTVLDMVISYTFGNAKLIFKGSNLTNTLYNVFGYYDGQPLYIPGAERNFFAGMEISF